MVSDELSIWRRVPAAAITAPATKPGTNRAWPLATARPRHCTSSRYCHNCHLDSCCWPESAPVPHNCNDSGDGHSNDVVVNPSDDGIVNLSQGSGTTVASCSSGGGDGGGSETMAKGNRRQDWCSLECRQLWVANRGESGPSDPDTQGERAVSASWKALVGPTRAAAHPTEAAPFSFNF
jgi:hypothetical protein